jgi:sec-independent protein translocase protein TatA
MNALFGFLGLGVGELAVIGIISVLLFGRKLPDMAKYLGRSVVEFKKGMHGPEKRGRDDEPDLGEAGSPVPRPSSPKPPTLDVRLDEPPSANEGAAGVGQR